MLNHKLKAFFQKCYCWHVALGNTDINCTINECILVSWMVAHCHSLTGTILPLTFFITPVFFPQWKRKMAEKACQCLNAPLTFMNIFLILFVIVNIWSTSDYSQIHTSADVFENNQWKTNNLKPKIHKHFLQWLRDWFTVFQDLKLFQCVYGYVSIFRQTWKNVKPLFR